MKMIRNAIAFALLLLVVAGVGAPKKVEAQTIVHVTCSPLSSPFTNGRTGLPYAIDENGNTCITGTITASLAGFAPNGVFSSLTATGSSASVALPAGTTVALQNTGTTTVSCTLGVGAATALVNELQVGANSTVFVTPGSNTFAACIDQTGSASNVVVLSGGSGLGTGFGGGSGGGAVTLASGAVASGAYSSGSIASGAFASGSIGSGAVASGAFASGALAVGSGTDGWDVGVGITTVTAATVGSVGSVNAKLRLMTSQLDTINTNVLAPVPDCGATPCTNKIGVVGVNTWAAGVLGAMANYGTSPGGVLVPGVNAFITNTPAVTLTSTTLTGNSSVIGPTPDGTAASTNPVLIAGTVDGTGTGAVAVPKYSAGGIGTNAIDQTTPGTTNGVSQNASTAATATLQSAAVANGNGTVLNTNGMSSATLTVNCATCSGGTTINFEATEDGTNYSAVNAVQLGTTTISSTTAASGISLWEMPVAGSVSLRARVSGYSAGTVTVTGHAVPVAYNPKITASNVALYNGVAPLMGNGATGTGSPRGTVANDNTGIANWGHGATGSAPPSGATQMGALTGAATTGGLMKAPITCDNHVFKHITTATDTLAVQGVTSQNIYVCGWRSRAAGTATWYLEDTQSVNANCSSTLTQITGLASEVVNSGETLLPAFWTGLKMNAVSRGLCINSTGTGGVDVDIWYTQF